MVFALRRLLNDKGARVLPCFARAERVLFAPLERLHDIQAGYKLLRRCVPPLACGLECYTSHEPLFPSAAY